MARIESFFNIFNDSIVLIGPEEATFQDLAPTPFDQSSVPKVSVHGNLIKTLTHQEYLHRLPIRADHLATFGVCLVMAFLAVYQGKAASIVQARGLILLIAYVLFWLRDFFPDSCDLAYYRPCVCWVKYFVYWAGRYGGDRTKS